MLLTLFYIPTTTDFHYIWWIPMGEVCKAANSFNFWISCSVQSFFIGSLFEEDIEDAYSIFRFDCRSYVWSSWIDGGKVVLSLRPTKYRLAQPFELLGGISSLNTHETDLHLKIANINCNLIQFSSSQPLHSIWPLYSPKKQKVLPLFKACQSPTISINLVVSSEDQIGVLDKLDFEDSVRLLEESIVSTMISASDGI